MTTPRLIEPLFEYTARMAGAAVGRVAGAGVADAIVMASASSRGDTLYTSDVDDLAALQRGMPAFANVQIQEV